MKSFREILGEVAEPQAGDEIEFKAKHEIELIDHPVAFDHQFSGRIDGLEDDPDDDGDFDVRHSARPADLVPPEDEDVYESADHYRVLHNGKDVTKHDSKADAQSYARKYRSDMKKKGYDHTTVTVHAYDKNGTELREVTEAVERSEAEDKIRKQKLARAKAADDSKKLYNTVYAGLLPKFKSGKFRTEASVSDGRNPENTPSYANRSLSKDAAIKRIHAAGHTLASAINAKDHELLKHPSIGRRTLSFIRNFKVTEDTEMVAEGYTTISEAMKLDKVNIIHHADHPEHKAFAKAYRDAHIGDYRQGGPTEKDEKASGKFHSEYDRKNTRSGFAGMGTDVYTHKATGKKFEVDRKPNGKTFYGTDHHVGSVREGTELDEAKRTLKTGYIKDHAWIGKKVSHEGKHGIVKHVDREPTFSQMHPYKMNVHIEHPDGSKTVARKERVRVVKEDTEDLQELSPATLASYKGKAEKKVKTLLKTTDKLISKSLDQAANARRRKTADGRYAGGIKSRQTYDKAAATQSKANKVGSGIRLASKKLGEETFTENFSFKAGNHTFHDGGVRNVKAEEAIILNKLYQSVGHESKAKMLDHLNSSAENFNSLLAFAVKTLGK